MSLHVFKGRRETSGRGRMRIGVQQGPTGSRPWQCWASSRVSGWDERFVPLLAARQALVRRLGLARPRSCRHLDTCRHVGRRASALASLSQRRDGASRSGLTLLTSVCPDGRGSGTALAQTPSQQTVPTNRLASAPHFVAATRVWPMRPWLGVMAATSRHASGLSRGRLAGEFE